MSAEGSGLVPGDHPDRIKWNAKYAAGFVPSFRPNPLAARALALVLPDGPVADLACGPSGSALLAAEQGRRVTAVDVSEVGARAARRRGQAARTRSPDHAGPRGPVRLGAGAAVARAGAGHRLLGRGRVRRRGRRGGGRRPAGLGGSHRRRAPEASGLPRSGASARRARLAPAAGFTLIDQGDVPPRPPPAPGPPGPDDDPWSLISRRDTISPRQATQGDGHERGRIPGMEKGCG